MKVYRTLENVLLPNGSAVAIGMFDGIHTGHKMVLESALRQARRFNVPAVVFSFANHPQTLVSHQSPPLLSTLDERLAAFSAMGIGVAVVPDFTPAIRELAPEAFVKTILLEKLGAKSVSIGYDHHFGKNRAGSGDVLKVLGEKLGFEVQVIAPVRVENHEIVSSTQIRKLLEYGDVTAARALLGRPYVLSGPVIKGFGRGRQLGFPTANIDSHPDRLVPATGVYAGVAILNHKPYKAVCNIGFCPTFDGGTPEKRVEVFLFDYGDTDFYGPEFYGETLAFAFVEKIRDERRFENKEALAEQIKTDCKNALEILKRTESGLGNDWESTLQKNINNLD